MGISTMWSDGRHLEGVFSGYDDSFVLLKMPEGGKCVFNSAWVLHFKISLLTLGSECSHETNDT